MTDPTPSDNVRVATDRQAAEDAKRLRTAYELPDQIRPLSDFARRRTTKEKTPTVLSHYPAVVAYVYMSRYATASHIHRRFGNHAWNAYVLKSTRTTRYQLRNLVKLGFLKLADVYNTSPNFPHVYICTGRGLTFLRDKYGKELTQAREEAGSLVSIMHELFLTEFELGVWATIKQRADLKLRFTDRRYHMRGRTLVYAKGGVSQRLIPDAGFMLAIDRGQPNPAYMLYFVEVDNGTEAPLVVLDKFRTYEAWSNSEPGQKYLHDFYAKYGATNIKPTYRLLVIARRQGTAGQDERRLVDLFVQSLELSTPMRDRMWFTSIDATRAHAGEDAPLAAPIWLRTRDAKTWMHDYQAYIGSLPTGRGQKPFIHKRDYVTDKLPELPRHPVFPHPVST